MRISSRWRVPGILVVMAVAVWGPVLVSGLRSLDLAASASRAQHHAAAAQSYLDAARKLPWREDLWEQAGISAHAAGDTVTAVRLLRVGEHKRALSSRGWDLLGRSLWATGDSRGAISAWQDGSGVNPTDVTLLDRLAAAFHEQGEYDAEQAVLERRQQLAVDAATHYRLGLLLMLSDSDRAAQEIGAAATLDADVGPAAATLQAALHASSLESDPARRF
jgi:tetratricopeptide (TPR) repeat protein